MYQTHCRICSEPLTNTLIDLGTSPLSNALVQRRDASLAEPTFPLHVWICNHCYLVQLGEFTRPEAIFSHYPYFSSFSTSWVKHCETYAHKMKGALSLNKGSLVVELGSNDGYLLKHFIGLEIPVLGIEPAKNVAEVARQQGVPTKNIFFSQKAATEIVAEIGNADLIVVKNVLAQIPKLVDFVKGIKVLLKKSGILTVEFPHVLELIRNNQFDTIYHEHYSYFSILSLQFLFDQCGLRIFDVERFATHGGSLRIHVCHQENVRSTEASVSNILKEETDANLNNQKGYEGFTRNILQLRNELMSFLYDCYKHGKIIAAYGAPAKGNTLLNYCGIRSDLLPFTVDKNPHKQGTLLPGSRIPVFSPAKLRESRLDYVFVLPWNIKDEIAGELDDLIQSGTQIVTAIPRLTTHTTFADKKNSTPSQEIIRVSGPWVTQKEIDYVTEAAKTAWNANANVFNSRFESLFSKYIGSQFAVSLPSCTSAIHLSLLAMNVGPGDEVIVPDVTWIASAAPIKYVGATPVFADIDPKSWCLSEKSFKECITDKTKAVIPVNLYGGTPNYDAILKIAKQHNIWVIEDAAEAIGSEFHNRALGGFGDTGVFSFHGSKTLTTGEGGMLVTNQKAIYEKVLFLRDHGRPPNDRGFFNTEVAYEYKMTSFQAAFGLAQLERINELVERKREIFSWYRENLARYPFIQLNDERPETLNTFWMVTAVVDSALGIDKSVLIEELSKHSIECRPFFHPLSQLPAYSQTPEAIVASKRNKVSYSISPYGINLPSGFNITKPIAATVSKKLIEMIEQLTKKTTTITRKRVA